MGAQRSTPQPKKPQAMSTSAGVRSSEPSAPSGGGNGQASEQERTTRMSVKVTVSDHRALQRDKLQISEDLDGQRVTDQDVMAALLTIMLDNADLRKDVTTLLRKST